ncbi:MAG: sigma-70 family RNA polymerase sigma factor, partial [Clostridiales Family XIII bacterium]|nr:sigma-70 family RNA polymerase sigma factor [Clostridiales Family XIII bacterium]
EIALNLPEAREDLSKKLSRPPTIPELSAYLGKSEEDILEAMESGKNYNMHSLDQSVDAAKEEDKYEKINEYAQINEKGYEQFENADIFRSVMKQLTEDERKVFVARLLRNRSQRDVAKDLNVSQMTVSRMESNIKKKLKEEYFQ